MWDLPGGNPRDGFQGLAHIDDAQAVAFLAGDSMVVSADGHAVVRLSDAAMGNSLAILNGHGGKIWGISVAPDGTTFATVSSDGTAKLWDARLPRRWLAIPVPSGGEALAFSSDGQTLIVADLVGGKDFVPSDAPRVTASMLIWRCADSTRKPGQSGFITSSSAGRRVTVPSSQRTVKSSSSVGPTAYQPPGRPRLGSDWPRSTSLETATQSGRGLWWSTLPGDPSSWWM